MTETYWSDDTEEYREGTVLDINGSLALVEDEETGERDWTYTFNIR